MLIRYSGFILLGIVGQIMLYQFVDLLGWEKPIPRSQTKEMIDRLSHSSPKVVLFGDSVNDAYSANDSNRSSISGRLEKMGIPLVSVIDAGYDAAFFDATLQYMNRRNIFPERVVFEINMRSMSSYWNLLNTSQRWKEMLALKYSGNVWVEPWVYPMVVFGAVEKPVVTGRIQFLADADATIRNSYLEKLQEDQSTFLALMRAAKRLRKEGTRALFYITPLNCEMGQQLVGSSFKEQLAANVQTIERGLGANGFSLTDLSCSLKAQAFLWPEENYFGEHLKEEGRQHVAEVIRVWIESPREAK